MPKPTRTYPGFLKSELSAQGQAFIDCISGVLQGKFELAPLFRTKEKTHIYFAGSASRHGLLLEAAERPSGDPGVFVTELAFWCDSYPSGSVVLAEMTSHGWDAWLAAEQSGDKSLIEGPASKRNKVRDQQTADHSSRNDHLTLACGPASEAPGRVLGVPVQLLHDLLGGYGRAIQDSLPDCLSALVVPSEEMRTLEITMIDSKGRETTSEAEVPESYDVYLQNTGQFILSDTAVKAGGFGTVDDEHWQRPTRQFQCFLAPNEILQVDTLDAGDLDFVNWYYVVVSPPNSDSQTFEFTIKGLSFQSSRRQQILPLGKRGYKVALERARQGAAGDLTSV